MNDHFKTLYTIAADRCRHGDAWEWEQKYCEAILEDITDILLKLYREHPLEKSAILIDLEERIIEKYYGEKE